MAPECQILTFLKAAPEQTFMPEILQVFEVIRNERAGEDVNDPVRRMSRACSQLRSEFPQVCHRLCFLHTYDALSLFFTTPPQLEDEKAAAFKRDNSDLDVTPLV